MSARASASRYARALLDVAIDQQVTERVAQDLDGFAALVDGNAELRAALANPAVPVAGKAALVAALAARAGACDTVANLLRLLAERNRLTLIAEVRDAYHARLMEHQGVIEAEITTAVALEPARVDALRERLARVTGRDVTMTARTDASLVGGAVARVGSTVYDGSLATQLAKMKTRLGA